MTEQEFVNKLEWVDVRCTLRGEPLTETQKELLMFVFADMIEFKEEEV